MLVAIGNLSDQLKDHQILSNDSTTKLYMFNVENRYSKQSASQNAKKKCLEAQNQTPNVQMRKKRQFWAMKPVLR